MPFLTTPRVDFQPTGTDADLVQDLVYEGRDEIFTVPAGFRTDFASIPSLVAWLIPKLGLYTFAAILHDWFCVMLALGKCVVSAREADAIFRRVMREYGVPFALRWAVWTGVRWGALFNRHRRPGWLNWYDTPRVAGISLVLLPFVLPPTVLILLARAVLRLVSWLLRALFRVK